MEILTHSDLVQEIRDLTVEQNTAALSDEAILRILARGQRFVVAEIAKTYAEPFLAEYTPTAAELAAGAIGIPDDALEDRVLYVECTLGSEPTRIPWRRFDQVAALRRTGVTVSIPYAVYTVGRQVRFAGTPNGSGSYSMIYVRAPDPPVLSLGRISAVSSTHLGVELPAGETTPALSTEGDNLESYFNVVDFQTGLVKGTFQVQNLPSAGNQINVRSTPQRSTVRGRTVSGSSSLSTVASLDDFVCSVKGSCVPPLNGAITSFLTIYAGAEISRSMEDGLAQLAGQISEVYRGIAQQQDIGRGTPLRIKNTSKIWQRFNPARYLPGSK